MLTDPTNQIPGSSSNPGGSTQPSFTQMSYYPNFQPQYSNQEEQMLFHQFKMQMQMNKQQQSNQFTTSQPHSEPQSHHLVDETEEEKEEPLPTPTSKPNRDRKKSVAKRNKGKDVEVEKETKEWTPMNVAVIKFNQLYEETLAHSGENDENHMARVLQLYETIVGGFNPVAYQEFMVEQYDLDRKAKIQVLSQESEDRRRLIQAQKIVEDMKVLQIDTSGMDPTYAAIINAQKKRIRAEYLPPN
ncbi:hypothetical protein Tco_0277698 [Tanacetum coccineum]